jgi:hypothetical protein
MIGELAEAEHFLSEYVHGFMFHDIEAAIQGKANFLAALGLMEYTEILGGLITGKLKDRHQAKANFDAFLPYLGQAYVNLDKRIGLYDRVRCGLSHEYFIKGPSTIWMTAEMPTCGILWEEPKDWIHFVVSKYFDDFKSAVKIYQGRMVYGKDQELLTSFRLART